MRLLLRNDTRIGETSENKSHPMQDSSQASGIMQYALYLGVVRQIAK